SLLAAGIHRVRTGASPGQGGLQLQLPLPSSHAATALPAAASQPARSQPAAARLGERPLPPPAAGPDAPAPDAPADTAREVTIDPDRAHLRAVGLTAGWHADAPRIRDLDLDLRPGSRLAVTGASGTGKSTLLSTLAGLLDPLAGRV